MKKQAEHKPTMTNNDTVQQQTEGRRQYVWLIRYGRTDPPLLENIGNYDSDLHPDGIVHAAAVAERLASGHSESSSPDDSVPKILYSDPFLRCMRTADVIAKTLNSIGRSNSGENSNGIKIRVESGTTEWQVPSLLVDKDGERTHPRSTDELVKLFPGTLDREYRSTNPEGPDRTLSEEGDDEQTNGDTSSIYPPRFPETEEQLHRRCQYTIQRILADVGDIDSFAIVGHAPCVQSMALALMGGGKPEDSPELGPWSLGGMTLFSRPVGTAGRSGIDKPVDSEGAEKRNESSDKWTLDLYNDTSHMPGEYKDGKLGRWSLPSFDRISV